MFSSSMKIRNIFELYKKVLDRRPYLVQAIQTGTLMGAGDIISQTIIERKSWEKMDFKRTAQFSSIGFFLGGPGLRIWYGILNQHFGTKGKTTVMKKVFFDQVVFAPAFLFALLVSIGTMQGKSWETIQKDLKANYFDILKTNYCLWPFVQVFNFYFVPLQYQVLLVQSVALFWNTYLSWKTNRNNSEL